MKIINLLLSNWKLLIEICNENIEKGNDVEFYKACKEKALTGYEDAHAVFYKELAKVPKINDETENGSYQQDEDTRRFEMDEQLYLMDIEND